MWGWKATEDECGCGSGDSDSEWIVVVPEGKEGCGERIGYHGVAYGCLLLYTSVCCL